MEEMKYGSTFLDIGTTMDVSSQLHAPAAFIPLKESPAPIG
jgi:hypothetical protein